MNLVVLKVTKDNLDDAGDREDVPDPYEALNDDVLVVGENDVARVITMQNIFHDGSTSSHQLLQQMKTSQTDPISLKHTINQYSNTSLNFHMEETFWNFFYHTKLISKH